MWGLISAGASLLGGILGNKSNEKAADTQANATREAIDEQRRQYDLTRSDYAPYRAAGTRALGALETDISRLPTAREVMSDPGYQFGLNQGLLSLDRKTAAAGGRISGAALKAAARYGTDYASTGYSAAYQRRQDRLNRLAALAGVGQTATGGSAVAGANASGNISEMIRSQGDAAGAARLAQGNIWANTGNQLAAIGSKWASQNQFQDPTGGSGGTPGGLERWQLGGS